MEWLIAIDDLTLQTSVCAIDDTPSQELMRFQNEGVQCPVWRQWLTHGFTSLASPNRSFAPVSCRSLVLVHRWDCGAALRQLMDGAPTRPPPRRRQDVEKVVVSAHRCPFKSASFRRLKRKRCPVVYSESRNIDSSIVSRFLALSSWINPCRRPMFDIHIYSTDQKFGHTFSFNEFPFFSWLLTL